VCRCLPGSCSGRQVLSCLQVWSGLKRTCCLFIKLDPSYSLHLTPRFTGISFRSEARYYAYLRHYSHYKKYETHFTILSLVLHADRIPTFYLYRIAGVMLLVTALKLCTSLVPLADYNTKVRALSGMVQMGDGI